MNDLAYPRSSANPVDNGHYPPQARAALRLLSRLRHGRLDLRLPDGRHMSFGETNADQRADLRLTSWKPLDAALTRGDIGFAESYIGGDWSTSNLAQLLSCLIRNRNEIEQAIYGTALGRLVYQMRHCFNRNTKTQARRNIHAHYDLGNEFYRLWLDPTMTYSSAIFERRTSHDTAADDDELVSAQRVKYERVLRELALAPNARVLELGCGWGGFGEVAGGGGHRVTGITLSSAQLEHAQARLTASGIAADLRLQDYRDVDGQYDGIASIEMFEAVGEKYWPSFFATLKRCLAQGGRACVQTIVIDDGLFARYRAGTDFIQQYIFPGGMLPSPSLFEAQAERAGLVIVREHRFGADYARTLTSWRARFHARSAEVRALGFDERFVRTWDFYLAYCEAAFACGNTDVIQYTLVHR